jgi:hypothetical protein
MPCGQGDEMASNEKETFEATYNRLLSRLIDNIESSGLISTLRQGTFRFVVEIKAIPVSEKLDSVDTRIDPITTVAGIRVDLDPDDVGPE